MQPGSVPKPGFDRVAERVAQIEQHAVALLGLVARDDLGLHLDAASDRVDQGIGIAREDGGAVLLEPGEIVRIAQQRMFHDLAVARAHLPVGQRRQRIGVGQHQARLVKRADQVLAERRVDAGLAAHR